MAAKVSTIIKRYSNIPTRISHELRDVRATRVNDDEESIAIFREAFEAYDVHLFHFDRPLVHDRVPLAKYGMLTGINIMEGDEDDDPEYPIDNSTMIWAEINHDSSHEERFRLKDLYAMDNGMILAFSYPEHETYILELRESTLYHATNLI